jgi:hypothetical protein
MTPREKLNVEEQKPRLKAYELVCHSCHQRQTWMLPADFHVPRCWACGSDACTVERRA